MWFASIWIFTLRLPWELGADFFYRHLIDGDPASNTLGWRWVAGLHTKGKTYLATPPNIEKYAAKRLDPLPFCKTGLENLNTQGFPLKDILPPSSRGYEELIWPEQPETPRGNLHSGFLITENDLSTKVPVGTDCVAALEFCSRSPIGLGSLPVEDFVNQSIAQTIDTVSHSSTSALTYGVKSISAILKWATQNRLESITTARAPVGPVRDALKKIEEGLTERGIRLSFIVDDYDRAVWPHTTRGFFQLNREIEEILEKLKLDH